MKTIGIIPARYASSRFPGKPLVLIQGKTMIQRVYEQASLATELDQVVIATDDERIFQHAESFGANVRMTGSQHQSGTDRCVEVLQYYPEVTHVINIQGDEPFIDPEQINLLAVLLKKDSDTQLASLMKKIDTQEALFDENIVKVVFNQQLEALYFSRSPIPFYRDTAKEDWIKSRHYYKHVGLYGYQASVLKAIGSLPRGQYEAMESLEQLRWLEAGFTIKLAITELETTGVDRPEDLEQFN